LKIKMKYLKYGLAIISGIAIVVSTLIPIFPPQPPHELPIVVLPFPIGFTLPIP